MEATIQVTKEEFQAYERVRASGVINMWATRRVEKLTGLDRDTIYTIMKHYADLNTKYPGVRKGR